MTCVPSSFTEIKSDESRRLAISSRYGPITRVNRSSSLFGAPSSPAGMTLSLGPAGITTENGIGSPRPKYPPSLKTVQPSTISGILMRRPSSLPSQTYAAAKAIFPSRSRAISQPSAVTVSL